MEPRFRQDEPLVPNEGGEGFEQRLLGKAEFRNIDLEDPANAYHRDMLDGVVKKEAGSRFSLIEQTLEKQGFAKQELKRLVIEALVVEDISFGIGTKRNVDKFTLEFSDGKFVTMSVSLDLQRHASLLESPSWQEAQALRSIPDPDAAWCVQHFYGARALRDLEGIRGLICKEFIAGQMLANVTADIESSAAALGSDLMKEIAFQTGRMIRNAQDTLHGVPRDSNALNIIIAQQEDGHVLARYCDVEDIVTDKRSIEREMGLLKKEFGSFAKDFERGIAA